MCSYSKENIIQNVGFPQIQLHITCIHLIFAESAQWAGKSETLIALYLEHWFIAMATADGYLPIVQQFGGAGQTTVLHPVSGAMVTVCHHVSPVLGVAGPLSQRHHRERTSCLHLFHGNCLLQHRSEEREREGGREGGRREREREGRRMEEESCVTIPQ